MKLFFNLLIIFTSEFVLADLKEISSDELGLYKQKVTDAYIHSSMICVEQGGILKPNYVIPSEQLFKIDSVQKISIDEGSVVSMNYTSDDGRLEYQYSAMMSADLQKIFQFKIISRKKSYINLGTLLEPNLVEGPGHYV